MFLLTEWFYSIRGLTSGMAYPSGILYTDYPTNLPSEDPILLLLREGLLVRGFCLSSSAVTLLLERMRRTSGECGRGSLGERFLGARLNVKVRLLSSKALVWNYCSSFWMLFSFRTLVFCLLSFNELPLNPRIDTWGRNRPCRVNVAMLPASVES